jgi:hypothetical protein
MPDAETSLATNKAVRSSLRVTYTPSEDLQAQLSSVCDEADVAMFPSA